MREGLVIYSENPKNPEMETEHETFLKCNVNSSSKASF